jgi:general secretion pathway protein M
MNALGTWWRGREPRERAVLAIGLVAVVAMLLWAFAWKPLDDRRDAMIESNARLAADLAAMRELAARAGATAVDGDAARERAGQSLLALADAGLREAGLAASLRRIEPAGEGRVRLRLEAVAFDPLAAWLEQLSQRHGVRVAEVAATRTDYAGQVDVQLIIEDP